LTCKYVCRDMEAHPNIGDGELCSSLSELVQQRVGHELARSVDRVYRVRDKDPLVSV
jgi:hypothetical protein